MVSPRIKGESAGASAGAHPADPAATNSAAGDPLPPGPGAAARTRPTASKVPSRPIKGASAAIRLSVPHIAPQAFRLAPVRERDRTFKIDRRAAPPPDRCQSDASGWARIHLAVIERLAGVKFPLIQPIEEPGSEIGGDDLAAAKPKRSLEEHDQPQSGAGEQPSPAHALRRGSPQVPAQTRLNKAAGLLLECFEVKGFQCRGSEPRALSSAALPGAVAAICRVPMAPASLEPASAAASSPSPEDARDNTRSMARQHPASFPSGTGIERGSGRMNGIPPR